ncbi:hypothetical protein A9Q84_18645 [Halobacteriovorax marinus]|uniref:Lipoprotein n=1 Tax=Halobacteriovorax marinus TaxID=97084 RepID=A0A1Y5F2N9_9BACT|nr:hypothetical protein A9Q84_18645 [Halobacteriovorax marinus]
MLRTKLALIFILIFTTSCKQLFTDDELGLVFEKTLISSLSYESTFKINAAFPLGKTISRPVGVWQRLLETDNYCMDYRIPSKKKTGIITLVKKEANSICPALPIYEPFLSLDNISDFNFKLLNNFISGKKIRKATYGMSLTFLYKNEKRKIEITLVNMNRKIFKENHDFLKYQSFGTKYWKKGLRISRVKNRKIRTNPWLVQSLKKDSSGELNFCERVDRTCKVIGKNSCYECLAGWIPVVDFNCPNGGSKVCAPIDCGKKGMPACPRGTKWKGVEMLELCFDNSPAGFCEGELKTMCDDNKVLICN